MTDSIQQTDNPQVQMFKCQSCGAKMQFVPGSSVQQCPYCSHENPIPQSEADIREQDFRAYLASKGQEDLAETLTIKCNHCAAEFSTEPNITSQECPFCGSEIVATAVSTKHIKPKSLLPFHITRKQGRQLFSQWLSRLWFAPGNLKKMARQDAKLAGMYVPYWTYDTDTTTFYRGQRGEHYWVTEHYTTHENGKTVHKTRQVQKTRWYPASGTVWGAFDDVLVLASESLPRKYTEKLEPWDLQNLVPHANEYLSGFRTESYQIDLEQGFNHATQLMDPHIRRLVERDIGGDEQRISSMRTQYDNITFKYLLLPIWISAYRYKDKVYRFLVNGRTGEVQGERPWSFVKILLAVVFGLLAAGIIALLVLSNVQ